jgi:hypothetical protein
MTPIDIAITFGDGDDEETALALARRLFAVLDTAIDSLTLAPDPADDLTVALNGRLVYSRRQAARPPKVADVVGALDRPPA